MSDNTQSKSNGNAPDISAFQLIEQNGELDVVKNERGHWLHERLKLRVSKRGPGYYGQAILPSGEAVDVRAVPGFLVETRGQDVPRRALGFLSFGVGRADGQPFPKYSLFHRVVSYIRTRAIEPAKRRQARATPSPEPAASAPAVESTPSQPATVVAPEMAAPQPPVDASSVSVLDEVSY